jgi:hypothetical protein
MLGLAGIGHFYARLALPTVVPTLLLPRRGDFVRRIQALAALRHTGTASMRRGAEHDKPMRVLQ